MLFHRIPNGFILKIYKDETIHKIHGKYPLQNGGKGRAGKT